MSRKRKQKTIEEWRITKAHNDKTRKQRGIWHIDENELKEFNETLSEVRATYATPPVPAIPLKAAGKASAKAAHKAGAASKNADAQTSQHRDHVSPASPANEVSEAWFVLAHTPINMKEAMEIPEGLKALNE